ncbi:hypothetical protein PG987_015454 [Apiospora arundinis]
MDYSSSSRSSSGSGAYRSSHSSTYKKDVSSHGSKGNVVINHHARIYDQDAPRPDYSRTGGGSGSGGSSSSSSRHR